MAGRKTKGRQKIEIKKIENEDDRLVTFSKRRSGIYKKASELVTLCGAEVGVVVFSPAGRPFSYAHPSIDSVTTRYLNRNHPSIDCTHPLIQAHWENRINELNMQHNELLNQLEIENQKGKELQKITKEQGNRGWWEAPMDELNMEELKQMNASLEELHNKLGNKINEKSVGGAFSSSPPPMYPAQRSQSICYSGNKTDPSSFSPSYGYQPGHF